MATSRPPGGCPLIGRSRFSTYTPTCSILSAGCPAHHRLDYHFASLTQWPNTTSKTRFGEISTPNLQDPTPQFLRSTVCADLTGIKSQHLMYSN